MSARRRPVAGVAVALAAAVVLVLAACAGPPGGGGSPPLRVLAAASLHGPLDELVALHARETGGPPAQVTYDGSAALLSQLREGAVADVVALADAASTAQARDAGLLDGQPVGLATNTLRIAVPPGNPQAVRGLDDLARPGLTVVLCAPPVPCGAATRTVLDTAGVEVEGASEEQSVSAVLAKVVSGEADAGVVYVTDVLGADGAVDGVDVAGAEGARTAASAAVVAGAPRAEEARALLALLTSARGRAVFARYGFDAP
jgi:molybdate transport system substrate-binding protein